MKHVAAVLRKYREARRDVLLGQAARKQQALATAAAAVTQAQALHARAIDWRRATPVPDDDARSRHEFLRAIQPTAEALVARRAAAWATAAEQRREAQSACDAARRAVQQQERALLRGKELMRLLREADARSAHVAETLDDDDLACARSWRA